MESPSSVLPAGEGVTTGQEKISLPEGNKPKSYLLENGWHGYDFMKNGVPRPSAARDYPEGIVPLHCRERDTPGKSFASKNEKQSHTFLNISDDKVQGKQAEESMGAVTDEEGIELTVELSEHIQEVMPGLKAPTDQNPEKTSNQALKKMKTGQVDSKNIENASLKSSNLGERNTISAEAKTLKQATNVKQNKANVSSPESAPKKLLKAGKSAEVKQSTVIVSKELVEVRAGKKDVTLMSKTQKTVMTTSKVVSVARQEIGQPESQGQTDASEVENKQRDRTLGKEVEPLEKEEEPCMETEILSMKGETAVQDKPYSLTGPSDQGKSPERDASAAALAVQEVEKPELSPAEGSPEATNLDEQKKPEKGLEQKEEEMVVDQAKAEPAKSKSGTLDISDSLSPQAKKKVLKGVGHKISGEDQAVKASPSKVSGTTKENAIAENAKVISKTETDIGKPGDTGKKKRPLEGPNSGEKVKKMQKVITSRDEQTPLKAKQKKPDLETQKPEMGTSKRAARKPSNTSQPAKKGRQSAGKPAKPATFTGDVNNARKLVVQSIRLFDSVRRKFLQDEEKNGKQGRSSRADLQAASFLKEKNTFRGPEKAYGTLPGVFVGDIYFFRTELSFIRVHGPLQGGIEGLTAKDCEFNFPVAISIISNVGQDGEDHGDELVYTGQGGRSADNKQVADQKLERGNLAMDGSRKFSVPVRVIRGFKDMNSPTGKIYIYDGLYDVQETYTTKGSGGFDEFKFKLRRREDQPLLGSTALKLAADLKNQALSSRKDIVIADISKGKESQAICVENVVDEDTGPAEFQYATKLVYPKDLVKLEHVAGCKCSGGCTPSSNCSCFTQNGGEFLYLNGGYLVREKDFVYECGSSCSCSSSCRNRAPATGLKFRLDVFKTTDRGWGVRSLELIPAGCFVCEYVGEVVHEKQNVKESSTCKYMLSTNWLPETTTRWGDISNLFPDGPPSSVKPDADKPDLIIDASHVGNVSRFINHSCSPNLLVQKVLSDHQDLRYPQFKLFAIDNIPPLKELTFDYGHPPPDQEPDTEQIACLCGSPDCRGKLYV